MLSSLHEEILRLRSGTTAAAADKAEEDEWAEIGSKKKPIKVSQSVSVVSPIAAIFSGKLRASLRKGVGADTAVLEPFFVLPVDIESADTIVAALAHTFAAESLTDTGKKRAAKRQMMIDEMPPVLSLQLKRFVFDGHSLYKLCHHIAYPLDLTLDKAILSVSLRERAAAAAARTYRLLAVIYHHGEELSRGHYTCIVRVSPDRWVLFDDDRVVPLSSSEATMPRDDRTAYVLIYERPASFS